MIAPLPDSKLVQEATEICASAHTPSLLMHSMRVFVIGREIGRRRGLVFDEEGLLVASLFHDLGLSEPHRDPTRAFPEVGAEQLQTLVTAHGEPERALVLARAVDHHLQACPRFATNAESGLLHLANVIDVTGRRASEVGRGFLTEVKREFPRLALDSEGRRAVLATFGSVRSVARLWLPKRRTVTLQDASR